MNSKILQALEDDCGVSYLCELLDFRKKRKLKPFFKKNNFFDLDDEDIEEMIAEIDYIPRVSFKP